MSTDTKVVEILNETTGTSDTWRNTLSTDVTALTFDEYIMLTIKEGWPNDAYRFLLDQATGQLGGPAWPRLITEEDSIREVVRRLDKANELSDGDAEDILSRWNLI